MKTIIRPILSPSHVQNIILNLDCIYPCENGNGHHQLEGMFELFNSGTYLDNIPGKETKKVQRTADFPQMVVYVSETLFHKRHIHHLLFDKSRTHNILGSDGNITWNFEERQKDFFKNDRKSSQLLLPSI